MAAAPGLGDAMSGARLRASAFSKRAWRLGFARFGAVRGGQLQCVFELYVPVGFSRLRSVRASAAWIGAQWALAILVLVACLPSPARGEDRYALIVTGAAGGQAYAERYDRWRTSFVKTLRERFSYPADHLWILADGESADVRRATRENVRAAVAELRARAKPDDVVLVLLMGHGASADGDRAKFNLVGPDLTAEEWGSLFRPLAARVVFVDAASGSFPYLETLAGPNRVVVTANDSDAQQFETIMPEFFVKAFEDSAADLDKNGKVSIWEAFSYSSAGVARWFEERGQLATERPLLDDSGDGRGREAIELNEDLDPQPGAARRQGDAPDGQLARITYIQPEVPVVETGDAVRTTLLRRRAELMTALERLRVQKATLSEEEYELALEKLLVEMAEIDRRLRSAS